MILTLEVTGAQAGSLKADRRKTFQEAGGTIGRSPSKSGVSHWVLPDPQVSALHAVITCVKGVFYIEDRSRNGVFIGSFDNRLELGRPYSLKPDDSIIIDPYRIQVTLASGNEAMPGVENPFDAGTIEGGRRPRETSSPSPSARQPLIPDDSSGIELDPIKALHYDPRPAPAPRPPHLDVLDGGSPLHHSYDAPKPTPSPSPGPPIPDDWDKSVILRPPSPVATPSPRGSTAPEANSSPSAKRIETAKVPAPPPDLLAEGGRPARSAPASGDTPASQRQDVGLASMLEGAGLKDVVVTPELARSFGQILRVVVAGVVDVLEARQRIKEEFRLDMTTVQPFDNNPLKFSANVDDALHNLLVKRNAAYLGPVEAFEDAFDDVRNHQMAMLAGMRVAFEAMLADFDPDRLQEEFDRQLKKGARIPMPAKLLYWDLYRDKIHDMVADAETCFRELFGNEFATAYEEQLKRLKAAQRRPEKALDAGATSPDK